MNIWNKVFLGVISVAAIAVAILATVEFHVRNTGLRVIATLEDRTSDAENRIARIHRGAAPARPTAEKAIADLSLEELRGLVRGHYDERGRAWRGCFIAASEVRELPPALEQVVAQIVLTGPLVPDAAGALTSVAAPDSLRGVVYVFEESNAIEEDRDSSGGAAFLGRFTVAGTPVSTNFFDNDGNQVSGWRVTLITSDPLNNVEISRIGEASGRARLDRRQTSWAIYLAPPMLNDPDDESAQDFANMLDWLYRQRSNAIRDITVITAAIAAYDGALAQAIAENEILVRQDIPLEEKRVEAMETQRNAVATLLAQYEAEVARLESQIEELRTLLGTLVAGITEAQLQAAERIEEQVRSASR